MSAYLYDKKKGFSCNMVHSDINLPIEYLEEMRSIVPDYDGFLHSYELPPSKAFKVNERKIEDTKLLDHIGTRQKVPFAEHCYYLNYDEKWGNHAFHHAGLMYIQEPSAMAPINAYDLGDIQLALDMCAAPGGKTIQLASKVKYLVSNEINPSRAAVLKGNVERMGIKNTVITNHSPQELEKLGELFDLVLVDAPCSGEGMFRKDETAVKEWSVEHSIGCANRQYAILESAHKVLKRGGLLIYSTCTFSPRENEEIVKKFIDEHDYEFVMPSKTILSQTVCLSDEHMRRFYPHIAMGEGQFFAAMRKNCGNSEMLPKKQLKIARNKLVSEFLISAIGYDDVFCEHNGMFFLSALPFELPLDRIVSGGVRIGRLEGKIFKPDHCFFSAYGNKMFCYEPNSEELLKYLHGEELKGTYKGYGAITVLGAPLGGFKGCDGRYKNLYPKGLRI